jgi:hypothetical protein
MMPVAVASPYAKAGFGRADMRAGANAAVANTCARTNRTDMRAAIDTVTANSRANADNIAGMTAGIHTVIADAGACADGADMGAGTDTMAPDMRAHAHAKNTDAPTHIGSGGGRREQDERE